MSDFIPADFDSAYPELLAVEGGYAFVSGDSGGETYRGVSRNNWPSWPGWAIIDAYKAKLGGTAKVLNPALARDDELQKLIKAFYYDEFWSAVRGSDLDHRVACELFDTAVNTGTKTAIIMLQEVLNVFNNRGALWGDLPLTGNFLTMTMNAVQSFAKTYGWVFLADVLNLRQAARYFNIIQANESQEQFARGWFQKRVLEQMK